MSITPKPPLQTEAPPPIRARFQAGSDAETVLVVDDERFFLTILGDFLTHQLGMRAILVQDSTTALSTLESEKPDLVLLDILMPDMDGLEVLRRIKDRSPGLPVVMVTASTAIDHAITALREGADDFVRKPLDLDELELCINRALNRVRVARLPPPPPRDAASERRRAPRIRLRAQSPAELQLRDVNLIDLSLSGALVEHIEPIRPGEIYHLTITIQERKVPLLARAMRVFASHRVTVAGGERQVVYRTGMEFVGVEKETADLIAEHIAGITRQGLAAE